MKNILILILFMILANGGNTVCAQEKITRFQFAGYRAVFVPSDTFHIEINRPELGKQEVKGNLLKLTIKEPDGRMPKDTLKFVDFTQ